MGIGVDIEIHPKGDSNVQSVNHSDYGTPNI